MRHYLATALCGTLISLLPLAAGVLPAAAQQAVTPAPDPVVTVPAAPDDANESYDANTIEQLQKIVDLSRLVGGGIGQIFTSIKAQQQMLAKIRDAQIGPKNFPVMNGSDEVEGREAGMGLKEMADAAMNGAAEGPEEVVKALEVYRKDYYLDDAFALKDDETITKKMVARISSQGAIAASTAEDSYKRANASMVRLDGYVAALEESADLKTSVDINTRVMVEVAQQLNETLRTQAAVTSVASSYFMLMGGEAGKGDSFMDLKDFNR